MTTPARRRIAQANAIDSTQYAEHVADALAQLIALQADPRRYGVPEVYDGPEIPEGDGWSRRDLDELADRRAGHHYYEGI